MAFLRPCSAPRKLPPAAADNGDMNHTKPSSLGAILSALSLFACEQAPYGSTPETAYRIEGTCTVEEPWCDDGFDECYESGARSCNTCYEIGGFGCAAYCDYTETCRNRHCGRNDGCRVWAHTATLGEQDPSILEACQLASAHHVACGQPTHAAGHCELFAATERAQAAAVYQCTANSACGEEAACNDLEPDEGTSRRVCDAMAACGLSWASCGDGSLAVWLGWLRHDVKSALQDCAELDDCRESLSCLRGWLQSVSPQT